MNVKEREPSSNSATKTEKMPFLYIHIKNIITLEKYLKLNFENLTQKLIDFEAFYIGKVPKSSVFNRECLETSDF